MYCAECGKEIPEDSEFCGYCGAAAAAAPEQAAAAAAVPQGPPPAPPTPPTYEPPPPPPPGGATPPMGTGVPPVQYGPTPPKKSPLPWIIGILAVLAVAVIVLVLVFVVFKGDDNGGGKVTENPEETVVAFFKSWEEKDAKMLLGTMEPDFVDGIRDALGDDYVDLIDEYFFSYFPDDLKIEIEEMESDIIGDRAEVTIIEGTMTYTDEYGDKVSEKASEANLDSFELVKVEGKWYLSEDTLIDIGFDFSDMGDLEDMDLEDMEFDDGTSGEDLESLVELPVDSEDEVLTLLFEETEIWDWYLDTDLPQYEVSEEGDRWVAYLYELDEDMNEIPFAWYEVDKETGDVFMITNE